MTKIILGIDDAGRGPVIGPMVLAGCLIDEKTRKEFKKIGIVDSKKLTPKRREYFEKIIKEKAISYHIFQSTPEEILSKNKAGIKLNEVEGLLCAKIINKLNTEKERIKIFVDCPSVSISKWDDYLRMHVKNLSNLEISCEHKADENYVSVSAASILAKCKRDREISKLKEKYGEGIGSGYTSDPSTQTFLKKYAKKYENEGIFRKTWITWKVARENIRKEEKKKI